jgi:hypothetical protein
MEFPLADSLLYQSNIVRWGWWFYHIDIHGILGAEVLSFH